jgi:hypothetical protein
LTALPDLSNCQELYCGHNQLTVLPDLPNCLQLACSHNQLTTLPELPRCEYLSCAHNQLPFDQLDQWKTIWKVRKTFLSTKYIHLWYWKMLRLKANKKQKLHLELLWSPDTRFYQQREEYQHFINCSQT